MNWRHSTTHISTDNAFTMGTLCSCLSSKQKRQSGRQQPPDVLEAGAIDAQSAEPKHFLFIERNKTEDVYSASPMLFPEGRNYQADGVNLKSTASIRKPNNGYNASNDAIAAKGHFYKLSEEKIAELHARYKDTDDDAIMVDGIERLCEDLGYKPEDFAILVLAWRLDASQMCRFTKTEFINGLHTLNADSIDIVRMRLQQMIEALKVNADMFKQLYRFTFRFGLEPGNRIVLLDMAIILWRLVFTVHTPDILERWLKFLELHTNIRGIPKDTWNMFLNFAETCDITQYDDTEAWPSLFDDFVEYENDRMNQNVVGAPTIAADPKKDPHHRQFS